MEELDPTEPRFARAHYPAQLEQGGVGPWWPRELWLFDTPAPDARAIWTGSGKRSDFRLVSGAELLREFESSPGRFRVFCSRCGSPAYERTLDQPDNVRIRPGLLDQDPEQRPRAHIWVSAKAAWYEIADRLPQLPEGLPPDVRRTV